jgi:hypothetical protein
MEDWRNVLLTGSRQHSHQLFDRVEWLAHFERNLNIANVDKV